MKKKIYFLGYTDTQTKLIKFLKKNKKFSIIEYGNKLLTKKIANEAYLIISFGYKKIIKNNILDLVKRPIINLHISYLPFNRGSHPNFWSFIENTIKGVTIHEINNKIDNGNIIIRKKIIFKRANTQTFKKTYNILFKEIENLFILKFNKILNKNYKIKKIKLKGTIHYKANLPKNFSNWDINIRKYLKDYLK